MQDTLRQKALLSNDTLNRVLDTVNQQQKSDALIIAPQIVRSGVEINTITDTTSVCKRGVIADVTFYDSTSFIASLDNRIANNFPFTFIDKNLELTREKRESIGKSLKTGEDVPPPVYQSDWIVTLVLFALFLYALVRTFPGSFFRHMIRFFLMRGINENSSRETGILFQWQATLLNFASFIFISLFGYLSIKHSGITFEGAGNFLIWLICFGIVSSAIATRHFICNITGNFSGQQEIFREYLVGIYHFYRIAGIIYMVLVLLILYTVLLTPDIYFRAGFIVAGLIYLLRVFRLLLIFITRRVSIFYLILYLCALEILPVVIIVKYVTGLV